MKLFMNEDNNHHFKLGTDYLNEAAMRAYVNTYAEFSIANSFFPSSRIGKRIDCMLDYIGGVYFHQKRLK